MLTSKHINIFFSFLVAREGVGGLLIEKINFKLLVMLIKKLDILPTKSAWKLYYMYNRQPDSVCMYLSIYPLSCCDLCTCIHFMACTLITGLVVIRYWRNITVTVSMRIDNGTQWDPVSILYL